MFESLISLVFMLQAEHSCLAKNIYYEARNQPIEGQLAVADVTLNRVNHSRWPNTVCEVVYQPWQFSWVKEDLRDPYGEAWVAANILALRSMIQRKNKDIYHFHATYVYPDWADRLTVKKKIKDHIFYS